MTLHCIAIDDEPPALDLIADEIGKVPFLDLLGTFHNPMQALDLLRAGAVDLLFLDIRMPELTGLELLRALPSPPMTILASAYAEYALEGFELDVVDYLLKPYTFERFLRACNKARWHHQLRHGQADATPADAKAVAQRGLREDEPAGSADAVLGDYVFVKSGFDQIRIDVADIHYIEGLRDYVKLQHGRVSTLALLSLKHLLHRLPADRFVRVHRSYIVALDKIEALQGDQLLVQGRTIPVGGSYRDDLMRRIEARRL